MVGECGLRFEGIGTGKVKGAANLKVVVGTGWRLEVYESIELGVKGKDRGQAVSEIKKDIATGMKSIVRRIPTD